MSSPELWLDANIARSPAKVRELANLARTKGIAVLAHAQVHLEVCRQARERAHRAGDTFKPQMVEAVLNSLGVTIAEAKLDRSTAETWARLLHDRFPTDDAWKKAKLSAVRASLPEGAILSARRVPFTTDWLVALDAPRPVSIPEKARCP